MAGGGVPRVRWQVVVAKAMAGGRGGDGDGGDGGSDGDGGSGGGGGADEPESRRSGHGAVRRGEGMRVPRFGAPQEPWFTWVHASLWFPGFLSHFGVVPFSFSASFIFFLSLQTFLHLADRKPRWCPSLPGARADVTHGEASPVPRAGLSAHHETPPLSFSYGGIGGGGGWVLGLGQSTGLAYQLRAASSLVRTKR